jgi:hypothetical protein
MTITRSAVAASSELPPSGGGGGGPEGRRGREGGPAEKHEKTLIWTLITVCVGAYVTWGQYQVQARTVILGWKILFVGLEVGGIIYRNHRNQIFSFKKRISRIFRIFLLGGTFRCEQYSTFLPSCHNCSVTVW